MAEKYFFLFEQTLKFRRQHATSLPRYGNRVRQIGRSTPVARERAREQPPVRHRRRRLTARPRRPHQPAPTGRVWGVSERHVLAHLRGREDCVFANSSYLCTTGSQGAAKIDVAEMPLEHFQANLTALESRLESVGYGAYCVDCMQDFAGTLDRVYLVNQLQKEHGFVLQGKGAVAIPPASWTKAAR